MGRSNRKPIHWPYSTSQLNVGKHPHQRPQALAKLGAFAMVGNADLQRLQDLFGLTNRWTGPEPWPAASAWRSIPSIPTSKRLPQAPTIISL